MSSQAPRVGVTLVSFACCAVALALGCARAAAPPPPVEVWLGGDVHVGAATAAEAAGRLAPLGDALAGLGIVNLEGPVADGPDAPPARLANHPAALAGLRAAGVTVVGVANNHARDGGAAAPAATVAAVRAAGLVPAGADAGLAVITRGGLRLVVAALALDDASGPAAVTAALAGARARGDALIVTLHVVATPSYLPGPALIAAVEAAVAAGAVVVAVHGSHALARVERRGHVVIAWGLGNLLFACDCTDETDGLIVRVALTRAGVIGAELVPIAAGLRGAAAGPAAEPALIFALLASLRSSPLTPAGDRARW